MQSRIQSRINGILEETQADEYQLYLTTDDKSNFRYDVATIKPYKGHRQSVEKPHWYKHIRNFLVDQRGAIEISDMEADDAMAIEQYDTNYIQEGGELVGETIICSKDKDLAMVPGWHYGWHPGKQKEKGVWFQDEIGGLRCFYKQLLTGDSTDNIPGLYGVGQSSTLLKKLDSMDDELTMYDHVFTQYELRFGSYAEQFLVENARLLFMLQYEGQVWLPPDKR